LFDWVSFPVTTLIRSLFENEIKAIDRGVRPCPFRVELLASLERTLCFCHTGNTAVLATSLMNPLGLSRGLIKDGFPHLNDVIFQRTGIHSAMVNGFEIKPQNWPMKGLYPAVASKRTQIRTYSLDHFMVSPLSP
jgi:hypothetical protein